MSATRHRILVVDDDASIRTLLHAVLTSAGYEVDLAEDGEVAVERIAIQPPDLVILDMVMPGTNGWGVLRRLPENPPPVIAVSGEYVAPAALGLAPACVRGYVMKPFHMETLLKTCARLVGHTPDAHEKWSTDRRSETRRAVGASVTLLGADRKPLAVGRVTDVSHSGLRIQLGVDLIPGQKVRLAVDLPGANEPTYLRGVACWSAGGSAGVSLTDVTPDARKHYDAFVRGAPPAGTS
jgi:CheY-like chemotaxis protein